MAVHLRALPNLLGLLGCPIRRKLANLAILLVVHSRLLRSGPGGCIWFWIQRFPGLYERNDLAGRPRCIPGTQLGPNQQRPDGRRVGCVGIRHHVLVPLPVANHPSSHHRTSLPSLHSSLYYRSVLGH